MLYSMTGYGQAKAQFGDKTIKVDIRTLNGKNTDVRLKVPAAYRALELDVRKKVLAQIQRGKIDVSLTIDSPSGEENYAINKTLISQYFKELTSLDTELNASSQDILQMVMRIPNVVSIVAEDISKEEKAKVAEVVDLACQQLIAFREEDGRPLLDDLTTQSGIIKTLLDQVATHEAARVENLRARLTANIEKELEQERIDNSRFDQELFYYIEKLDISEEKTRLAQHLLYFNEVLNDKNSVKGKKLTFISQEIGREINTMGAKAQDTNIQRIVVNMKDALEKIKEQIANIL